MALAPGTAMICSGGCASSHSFNEAYSVRYQGVGHRSMSETNGDFTPEVEQDLLDIAKYGLINFGLDEGICSSTHIADVGSFGDCGDRVVAGCQLILNWSE